jgi:predicted O-methyltransferase YrrM
VSFLAEFLDRCARWSDINEHLPTLYDLARGKDVIELGVRSGNSTAAFLAAVEQDGHLWSVDIDRPRIPEDWFSSPHWTFIQGDDLHVADQLPSVDIVFIDTSHTFEQTSAELDLYLPKIQRPGLFLLHDTEVVQPENTSDQPPCPVKVAVDGFCHNYGFAWTNHTNNNGLAVVEVT